MIDIPGTEPPWIIDSERVIFDEGMHQYEIIQTSDSTCICVYKIDAEGRRIIEDKSADVPFIYKARLFNFSKTTRDKILFRVKTMLIFQ